MRRERAERAGTRRPLTSLDAVLAVAMGAASLALYVRTLYPGLLPGDSGEFQVLARLLGNTHPTGYQVYLLLAHVLTWLPVGSIAYRVNLFSAVMAALTVGEIYLAGRLLTGRRWPATLAASAVGVSATFWSQALIAEVYTAGAAFYAGVLLAAIYWERTGRRWALWAAGMLGGLSLGVHLTVVLAAPAAGLLLWFRRRAGLSMWTAALSGAVLGTVLAVGAFLALDWRDSPADFVDIAILPSRSVWGMAQADLDSSWERLAFSLTGRQFREPMFADPARVMRKNTGAYVANLGHEFSGAMLALAGLGIVALARRARALVAMLLVALLAQWLYAFNYDIHDIYVFHISGYLVIALLSACGAGMLADWASGMRWAAWVRHTAGAVAVLALCFYAIWPVLRPRADAVWRGEVPSFPFDAYPVEGSLPGEYLKLRLTVEHLEEDAILFAKWRYLYPYYYWAHLAGARTDLTFIEEKPHRTGQQEESSMLAYVSAQIESRPIYFADCLQELRAAGYRCWPVSTGAVTLYQVRPARVQ